MRFIDAFGDELKIKIDDNPDIVNLTILEDADDNGYQNSANFILNKEQSKQLIGYLNEIFNIV